MHDLALHNETLIIVTIIVIMRLTVHWYAHPSRAKEARSHVVFVSSASDIPPLLSLLSSNLPCARVHTPIGPGRQEAMLFSCPVPHKYNHYCRYYYTAYITFNPVIFYSQTKNLPLLTVFPPQLISIHSFCYSQSVCVCVFCVCVFVCMCVCSAFLFCFV